MNYKSSEIAKIIDGEIYGNPNVKVCGVSIDSREFSDDDCFFAIKGQNFDGGDFAQEVFENGCKCAVVNCGSVLGKKFGGDKNDLNFKKLTGGEKSLIVVDDTIKAMGKLANHYRNRLNCKVISVTGSVGKTTTRDILGHVLSLKFNCHKAIKSFNNNIGLPLTIFRAKDDVEILITELGSNHPGEIRDLTDIAEPNIAVITKVADAHLEGFGSIENIVVEKASIAKGLKENGILFANGSSNLLIEYLIRSKKKFRSFGTSQDCDLRAESLVSKGFWGTIIIDSEEIRVPLAGMGNLENTLAAWGVCRELGVDVKDFKRQIASFRPADMRLEIAEAGEMRIICDCYNANPCSMRNALECLESAKGKKRSVFICGTMGELGEKSRALHGEVGKEIGKKNVDVLVCVGEFAGEVVEGAIRIDNNISWSQFVNSEEVCDNLHKILKHDDIVLIKGSRSTKLEAVFEKIKQIY